MRSAKCSLIHPSTILRRERPAYTFLYRPDMASPPNYSGSTSPPGPSSLALPRQRPTLALPAQTSRRASQTSSTSAAHPLRQTSFPPPDLEAQHAAAEDRKYAYSPSAASNTGDDFSDDNDIVSAISGPVGDDAFNSKKRKRGERRPRGRPSKQALRAGSMSVVNGDEPKRRGTTAAPSATGAAGDDADGEDEDDEEEVAVGGGRVPIWEGGQMTAEEKDEESRIKGAFTQTVSAAHRDRMDLQQKVTLKTGDVRKLVNQTLSQSVPPNVILAVKMYSKLFAARLIEEAREVQAEWLAVEEKRPDGSANRAYQRLRQTFGGEEEEEEEEVEEEVKQPIIKSEEGEASSSRTQTTESTQPRTNGVAGPSEDIEALLLPGAGGLERDIDECDRGPLTPDHLREALRRYKRRRAKALVGYQMNETCHTLQTCGGTFKSYQGPMRFFSCLGCPSFQHVDDRGGIWSPEWDGTSVVCVVVSAHRQRHRMTNPCPVWDAAAGAAAGAGARRLRLELCTVLTSPPGSRCRLPFPLPAWITVKRTSMLLTHIRPPLVPLPRSSGFIV
nr:transcription initiation factor tfiid subunit 11 [Quercus suber]